MANGLDSLSTQYKHQLRSLNPLLPQVIEHLVSTSVLTRNEATQVFSTSDQFSRLCQQLALKGTESKATIVAVIESFRRAKQLGQRETQPKHVCVCENTCINPPSMLLLIIMYTSSMHNHIKRAQNRPYGTCTCLPSLLFQISMQGVHVHYIVCKQSRIWVADLHTVNVSIQCIMHSH